MISSCSTWLRARHTGAATRFSARRYLARGFPLLRGFTLVELLTVSAIAGIFLALAVPALGSVADSMKLSSQSNVYLSSLHLARGEAIKRNSRVTVCKSADGVNCSSTGGWHQGWIIFHDANDDGIKNAGEPVIQQVQALPVRSRLTGNANVANYVSFTPAGGTRLVSGAFQAGTLTLCHASTSRSEARQVVINSAGRPRIQRVTVNNCV